MDATTAQQDFLAEYPSIAHLEHRARQRVPGFAFEYLIGGCNDDVNLQRNRTDLQQVQLMPAYLRQHAGSSLRVRLFDREYAAPFGIAPIGLQGLIWPNSAEILACAAARHDIPFILSTVTTSSIERIAELTAGRAWFQLYHPVEDRVRDDILQRAAAAGCPVLVVLSDVPTFGFRPRDIRNGLSMPPRMTLRNIWQMLGKPRWVLDTLRYGAPNFETLRPYMPRGMNMKALGLFMDRTFAGRLHEQKLAGLRDRWQGKLVVKGIVNEEDAEKALRLGVDGIIVSNHGGRQLDVGESTIKPLIRLAAEFGDKMTVMMDSGIRSGPDIARALAAGAAFAFLGRSFMFGVAALGDRGGNHTIAMLKMELQQVLEQLCCESVADLPRHLIRSSDTSCSPNGA